MSSLQGRGPLKVFVLQTSLYPSQQHHAVLSTSAQRLDASDVLCGNFVHGAQPRQVAVIARLTAWSRAATCCPWAVSQCADSCLTPTPDTEHWPAMHLHSADRLPAQGICSAKRPQGACQCHTSQLADTWAGHPRQTTVFTLHGWCWCMSICSTLPARAQPLSGCRLQGCPRLVSPATDLDVPRLLLNSGLRMQTRATRQPCCAP